MDSGHINVPLRSGGKKMKKRRELDALLAYSLVKRNARRGGNVNRGAHSQDKLLSVSTDEAEDYAWPKITYNSQHRCRFIRTCGPIILFAAGIFIFGIMCWLYLDLREQMYEYRQKLEEVSVASQSLPDIYQKYHETSAFLMKNQSTLYTWIINLQRNTENLQKNLSDFIKLAESQDDNAKNKKLVADFGAKIEATITDIESIKEHYTIVVDAQKQIKENLNELILNISTFQNVTKMLENDLANQRIKLDALLETSANITANGNSIQNYNNTELRQKFKENDFPEVKNLNNNKQADDSFFKNLIFKVPPTKNMEAAKVKKIQLPNATPSSNIVDEQKLFNKDIMTSTTKKQD